MKIDKIKFTSERLREALSNMNRGEALNGMDNNYSYFQTNPLVKQTLKDIKTPAVAEAKEEKPAVEPIGPVVIVPESPIKRVPFGGSRSAKGAARAAKNATLLDLFRTTGYMSPKDSKDPVVESTDVAEVNQVEEDQRQNGLEDNLSHFQMINDGLINPRYESLPIDGYKVPRTYDPIKVKYRKRLNINKILEGKHKEAVAKLKELENGKKK